MNSSDHPHHREDDNEPGFFENYTMNGKIIISALGILFFMVFTIIILHMYAKWCWRRRYNMQQRTLSRLRSSLSSVQRTCKASGLDKEVVDALPVFTYMPQLIQGANLGTEAKAAECAVCLAEFRQDEPCKLLPICKHFFHVGCIDMWFLSHATCPLCRTTAGLLLVDEEAGYSSGHCVDGSCDQQCQEVQRGLQCVHVARASGDEEQEPGDDVKLLNNGIPSQARKWRRSFSDKFPCVRDSVPSSNRAYMASHTPLVGGRPVFQITSDNLRCPDRKLVAISSCSSISGLVSPRWVSPHPHVHPPILKEPKSLTRVLSK